MSASEFSTSCPIPIRQYPRIQMAHGGGGKLMHQLLENIFLPAFGGAAAKPGHDSVVLEFPGSRLAFTTDTYVVRPILFPGGDIGSLSIHGTVNDLAMSGARPLCLSAGFILEEGLEMEVLWRVVRSMAAAAKQCGVRIVTGDTKVVDQGSGDGLLINTAGIGVVEHSLEIGSGRIRDGDVILVNGDLGRHGMAIMSVREGLAFETTIESDSLPLAAMVGELISAGIEIHCLRDLTRGGLASALNELATASGLQFTIEEKSVPVREDVHAACEILGLDPLHVACEGRLAAFVSASDAERALAILRNHPAGTGAVRIGTVRAAAPPLVLLKSTLGVERILDMASGEQLPRIC